MILLGIDFLSSGAVTDYLISNLVQIKFMCHGYYWFIGRGFNEFDTISCDLLSCVCGVDVITKIELGYLFAKKEY
jgi:hypothetical protein